MIVGNDGVARAAVVRVGRSTLRRPLQLLYPLEVSDHSERQVEASELNTTNPEEDTTVQSEDERPIRVRRTAAQHAADKILAYSMD